MKSEKLTEMLNKYFATTASKKTIYGFNYDGVIYAFDITPSEMAERARESVSTSLKNGTRKATIKLNELTKAQKQAVIISKRATMVCTLETLEGIRTEKHLLNNGQAFEDIIKILNGLEGYKLGDCTPYYIAGDCEINGEQVQIKFGQATLAEYELIEKAYATKA